MKSMLAKAKLNYLRIAPRKMRLLTDAVRGKNAKEVEKLLSFSIKKGAAPLLKLLQSAMANAKNSLDLKEETLYIVKITVDEGPKLKRWRARSRGRAFSVQKKTSHITLVLEGEKEIAKKQAPTISAIKQPKQAKSAVLESDVVESEPSQGLNPRPEGQEPVEKARSSKPQADRRPFKREKTKKIGAFNKIFRRKSF